MAEKIHHRLGEHVPIYQRREQDLGELRKSLLQTSPRRPAGELVPEDVLHERSLARLEELHLSCNQHF